MIPWTAAVVMVAAVWATAAAVWNDPPLVTTPCGPVVGRWFEVPPTAPASLSSGYPPRHGWGANGGSVRVAEFRSIPFALPPTAELRWQPPRPAPCWSGTYHADEFKAFCVQPGIGGDEDCLYVTVRVPEPVLNGSIAGPVPTFVYIHGGSMISGSGNFEYLNPLTAAGNVVSVAVNYRLNLFGFLATAELSATQGGVSGNYGIQDQLAALRWVQANIASFRGDPTRVTLGGQSSGGTSIFALLASPASAGLFRAAIALSGSPNISMDLPTAHAQNAPLTVALGCGGVGNASAVVACLRAVPASTLVSAIPSSWYTPGMWGIGRLNVGGMGFAGLAIVDGVTVTMPFAQAMVTGLNGGVALLVGNMGEENDLAPEQNVRNDTLAQWQHLLNTSLSSWDNATIPVDIDSTYSLEASINPQLALDSFNTDYGVTCAFMQIAIAAKQGGKYTAPLYLYVNQWPPSTPGPGGIPSYAYHTWDWVAACENWGTYSPQTQDVALTNLLRSQWYDLMAHGALNATATGWNSVDDVPGFPSVFNTFVYARQDRWPYVQSGQAVGYKAATCHQLRSFGFDDRFWWVN